MLANFRALDDVNGTVYHMPYGYNVMSMWLNTAMFKQYGVPLPNGDWTWDEFEAAATKMAVAPNRYGFAIGTPVPGPFTDVYPWVLTAGGRIMNANQTACVAENGAPSRRPRSHVVWSPRAWPTSQVVRTIRSSRPPA